MTENKNKVSFIFFGSSRLSVIVLDKLYELGLIPELVVTTPDQPVGRKLVLTANIVKRWAKEKNIKVLDPEKLNDEFIKQLQELNHDSNGNEISPVFLVASYGRIIPEKIIKLLSKGILNIHPSLLPKYRGPSPLPTAILEDTKKTGVTIMLLDKEIDHGPIVAQKEIVIDEWPEYEVFEEMMAKQGAELFAEIVQDWVEEKIEAKEQDHGQASYTKKIKKEDGLLDLSANEYDNFRKIQAYHQWPQAYFIHEHSGKKIKVKVTKASFSIGKLEILKVLPEGKREMNYQEFVRGYGEIKK